MTAEHLGKPKETIQILSEPPFASIGVGVVAPVVCGLVIALTLPGGWQMQLMAGCVLGTTIATAVALRVTRVEPQVLCSALVSTWAFMALVVCLVAYLSDYQSQFLWSLNLIDIRPRVRSVLDVVIISTAYASILPHARKLQAKSSLARGALVASVALPLWFIAWALKIPGHDYLVLWADQLNESVRYFGAFDLCNSLWIGAVLPLSLLRLAAPPSETPAPKNSIWFVLALLALPVAVGYVGSVALYGPGVVDSLPLQFWAKKASAVFLWTALYEEVVYRLILMSAVCLVAPRANRIAPISVSVLLFIVAHSQWNLPTILYTAIAGFTFSILLLVSRRLDWPVASHWLATTLLLRWN